MNLAEFLLARIAEDEDVVRHCLEAVDSDRTEYAQQLARRTGPYSTVTSSSHCGQDMGPRGTVEAQPGRILAEYEAKRRIVEDMSFYWREYPEGLAAKELADRTLVNLALPYADHPDYDPSWRP